ncbi:MAG: HAD family hydrolase [Clostridia bacterium]|nr:HAD family hydrolase [Clostridia bacterium]
MIKAVIFDLDGTVCDSLSTIAHYGNMALEYNGFAPIPQEKYKYLVGDGKVILIHRMLKYYDADTEENYERVSKKYDCEYEKDTVFESKPFKGIPELLLKFKENGLKTAVLSNKPDNVTVPLVKQILGGLVDVCHGKRDNVPKKPDPKGVLLTAEELGVDINECVFVGDTNVDINTAKNAGIPSVGVLWGFRDEKELKDAGAECIVSNPSDIFDYVIKFKNRE